MNTPSPGAVGAWLAAAPMNRVWREGDGFHKQRTPWGQLAAAASQHLPLPVVMLSGAAWFDREDALYRLLHGRPVARRGPHALWLPALPGERLDRHVAGRSWAAAAPAVTAAFAALEALHRLDDPGAALPAPSAGASTGSPLAGASVRSLSHSDATARNALFDEPTRSVAFFDFETEHPRSLGPAARRAADLLALGGSLAAVLGPSAFGPLARCVRHAHGGSLLAALARQAREPDAVALAQAPLPDRQRADWCDALRG